MGVYQDPVREGDGATERFVEVARREHRAGYGPVRAAVSARAARRAAEPNCFTTGAFQQTVRSMTEKD
jgi:hypothetical protein